MRTEESGFRSVEWGTEHLSIEARKDERHLGGLYRRMEPWLRESFV